MVNLGACSCFHFIYKKSSTKTPFETIFEQYQEVFIETKCKVSTLFYPITKKKHQNPLIWGQNWRRTGMNIMKQWFPPIFAPSPNDCDPWPSRQVSPSHHRPSINWQSLDGRLKHIESRIVIAITRNQILTSKFECFWRYFDILLTLNY